MKEQLRIPVTFKIVTALLILAGIATFIIGFIQDPVRAWSNYLLNNYYFLSLSMGGIFFMVIQYISQAGWSSGFKRVAEAMMMYTPVAAIFFLLLYFGLPYLYHWSVPENLSDPNILHKSPFLNVPFFFIRIIVFFILWIFFILALRRFSLREDSLDPENSDAILGIFHKSEFYSRMFIFVLIISFSLATFDWVMSVETHWYSTIFSLKNLVSAFLHGVSILVLIVLILNRRGYFDFLNKFHLHDFSRYLFIFGVIWGYFWFSQYMIIWYGNIPEETSYYWYRWQDGWKWLFYLDIGLNWGVPFWVLLPVQTSRNKLAITLTILLLIVGQYVDLYFQIFPATVGKITLGWMELGAFLGYAGFFSLVIMFFLSRANLLPVNHPYLEESLKHQF